MGGESGDGGGDFREKGGMGEVGDGRKKWGGESGEPFRGEIGRSGGSRETWGVGEHQGGLGESRAELVRVGR